MGCEKEKSQKWPWDFWSNNRSIEIWKTRGKQTCWGRGESSSVLGRLKLMLLYGIKVRHWVGSWTLEFVVQSRIWDWSYKCGVSRIWRNQESSAWKSSESLSRRDVTWSSVSSITAGANKMSIDQCIRPHGDIGDLDTFHWVVGDESTWLKSVSEK